MSYKNSNMKTSNHQHPKLLCLKGWVHWRHKYELVTQNHPKKMLHFMFYILS